MVIIKQVGIGQMASGTIDGITYVTRGNVTFARSTPTMPAHVYTTPAAKKRRAIFNMIQMHLKHHLPTLRKTITPKGIGSAYTRYYSLNAKPLARLWGRWRRMWWQGGMLPSLMLRRPSLPTLLTIPMRFALPVSKATKNCS